MGGKRPLYCSLLMGTLLVACLSVVRADAVKNTNNNVEKRVDANLAVSVSQQSVAAAEKSVDLLKTLLSTKTMETFKKTIKAFSAAGSVFAFLGPAISLVAAFLPNFEHEQIMAEFTELKGKIDLVREDIKNLEQTVHWESTKLHYSDVIHDIQVAVDLSAEIGRSPNGSEQARRWQERLKEHCDNNKCASAVWALFDGVLGNRQLRNNIMQSFYEKAKGNRPLMIAMGTRVMQLLSGGITSLLAYETLHRGFEAAADYVSRLNTKLSQAGQAIQEAVDRCTKEFEVHMTRDLKDAVAEGVDKGLSNRAISENMYNQMASKYDWLEIATVVYNDMVGYKMHSSLGSRLKLLHYGDKKNAHVFYKDKDALRTDNDMDFAKLALVAFEDRAPGHATEYAKALEGRLKSYGMNVWGVHVSRYRWTLSWGRKRKADKEVTTRWRYQLHSPRYNGYTFDYLVLFG